MATRALLLHREVVVHDTIRTAQAALALAVTCSLSGCASTPTRPIDSGVLITEGAAITANDGSFAITPGARFDAPFNGTCWNLDDEAPLRADTLQTSARFALDHGARTVTVRVPSRVEPLHGVLQLCEASLAAFGPAARSYQIAIPEAYVEAAANGAVSVVYEPVDWRRNDGGTSTWYAWILWLSDRPL